MGWFQEIILFIYFLPRWKKREREHDLAALLPSGHHKNELKEFSYYQYSSFEPHTCVHTQGKKERYHPVIICERHLLQRECCFERDDMLTQYVIAYETTTNIGNVSLRRRI